MANTLVPDARPSLAPQALPDLPRSRLAEWKAHWPSTPPISLNSRLERDAPLWLCLTSAAHARENGFNSISTKPATDPGSPAR